MTKRCYLKGQKQLQQQMKMIQFILVMIKIQITNNQRKNIRENKRTQDNLELDHSETDERDQTENEELFIGNKTQKEGDGDDQVNTDIDQSEIDERDQRENP